MTDVATPLAGLALLFLAACAGAGTKEVTPGRDVVTTVELGPQDVLAGPEADAAAEDLVAALIEDMREALPKGLYPDERALFKRLNEAGAVWSASPLTALDWSGVAWGRGPITTMITDRHGIVSAHVPRSVGDEIRLVTEGGWPIRRTITGKRVLDRQDGAVLDIAVVRLDEPVPAGIAVYPIAAIDEDVFAAMRSKELPLLVTFNGRRATVSTLYTTTSDGRRLLFSAGSRSLPLREDAAHEAEWGDSGHPSFYVVDGALVLASHYHTDSMAGAGPNYSDRRVRAAIVEAVAALDAEAAGAADDGPAL